MKDEYHLDNDMYFQWAQLICKIPQTWKNKVKQNFTKSESNLLVLNHHFIRNARILTLDKLTAKEIYSVLVLSLKNKPTSQNYFENSFRNYTFDRKQIYLLPWIITINSYQRNFQYKIIPNMLYLHKKLYIFGKKILLYVQFTIQMMRLLYICFVNVCVSVNYSLHRTFMLSLWGGGRKW